MEKSRATGSGLSGGKSSSSNRFPFVGVEAGHLSLRCQATFVIFSIACFLLLAFSPRFSSSSTFLRSLFTHSSHLCCVLLRFLQPPCFVDSDVLVIPV